MTQSERHAGWLSCGLWRRGGGAVSATCRCGATWTGKRIEHCAACHQTFTGTRPGDMHRAGSYVPLERRCLAVEEMEAKGMTRNRRGQWTTGDQMPRIIDGSFVRSTEGQGRDSREAALRELAPDRYTVEDF